MDHDSTKDGAADGDRRNWRERLGVGQDLPKISDEFGPARSNQEPSDAKPSEGEPAGAHSGTKPGTPVARPAPMAPRYARPAAPKPANGSSSGEGTNGANPPETARNDPSVPGLNAWAAPSQPARDPDQDHGDGSQPPSSNSSPASEATPAPSRGSAYPQAARHSGAAPASTGESFGERLRAQREAAEKLAQQRLAAARERSLRASADALAILAPHKTEAAPQDGSQHLPQSPTIPPAKPAGKPAAGEQPRFTFAQEEIVAARQETAFAPDPAPKAEAPSAPDDGVKAPPPAPDQRAPDEPKLYSEPQRHATGAPEYRHEDDAMFEDDATFEDNAMFEGGQPPLQAAPPRASAEDYSAAYREFEDEFEEEPRRRSGPLLLLASLAALAVASGGAIYWYQQAGSSQQLESAPPAAEATNVPVIAAPTEPAKADPPAQEPQQAAAPTTRKEIYDRIIGEETLEPERIVPTEEAPLRQIQQPGATEAGRENPSGEPLPLPLPPPPGTGIGEQGDLLVPGAATIQTASAEPEPEPELSFPEPKGAADPGRHPADGETSMAAALEPGTGNAAAAEAAASAGVKMRGTAAVTEAPEAPEELVASRPSIYPEVTEPLAYPRVRTASSPPHDQAGEPSAGESSAGESSAGKPGAGASAALAEPQDTAPDALQAEQEAAPAAEPEAVVAEAEPEGERTSDVPLPKAKPEPPVRVTTAPQPAPQPQAPQPQRQAAAPSSSGPVQIIPTDESQAPTARAVQPQAQSAPPRRRTVGREPDPLARPGSTFASSLNDSLNAAPSRQVASVAPDTSSQPQPAPSQPSQSQSAQADLAGGYLVQLASFRSEADALKAYEILVQRHPQLVGSLDSRVREASLGQVGSFWRLGVGPLSNRTEATRLCNALIAAGEKDCLVRRN